MRPLLALAAGVAAIVWTVATPAPREAIATTFSEMRRTMGGEGAKPAKASAPRPESKGSAAVFECHRLAGPAACAR
jgi:hypothetical protein